MPWYWERHPEGPFATLIAVATTYLDPEIYDLDSLNMLKALARRQDDEKMRVFKSELREAIRDPSQLPEGEHLYWCLEDDDGLADEAFLWRLWRELYGDEPCGAEAAIEDRIARLCARFIGRVDPQALAGVRDTARAAGWAQALAVLSTELVNRKVQVSPAEIDELGALFAAAGMAVRPIRTKSGTIGVYQLRA